MPIGGWSRTTNRGDGWSSNRGNSSAVRRLSLVGQFLDHHVDELDHETWATVFDVRSDELPQLSASRVLSGLVANRVEREKEASEVDLGLPGGVSDYLLCVRLSSTGEILSVEVES